MPLVLRHASKRPSGAATKQDAKAAIATASRTWCASRERADIRHEILLDRDRIAGSPGGLYRD